MSVFPGLNADVSNVILSKLPRGETYIRTLKSLRLVDRHTSLVATELLFRELAARADTRLAELRREIERIFNASMPPGETRASELMRLLDELGDIEKQLHTVRRQVDDKRTALGALANQRTTLPADVFATLEKPYACNGELLRVRDLLHDIARAASKVRWGAASAAGGGGVGVGVPGRGGGGVPVPGGPYGPGVPASPYGGHYPPDPDFDELPPPGWERDRLPPGPHMPPIADPLVPYGVLPPDPLGGPPRDPFGGPGFPGGGGGGRGGRGGRGGFGGGPNPFNPHPGFGGGPRFI